MINLKSHFIDNYVFCTKKTLDNVIECYDELEELILLKKKLFNHDKDIRAVGINYVMNEDESEMMYRCKSDIEYFANVLIDAMNDPMRLLDELMYKHDKEFTASVKQHFSCLADIKNSNTISMKSDAPITEVSMFLYTIVLLHDICFEEGNRCICCRRDLASEFNSMIMQAYKALPYFMKPGISIYNSNEIRFESNRCIRFLTPSKHMGIGMSIDRLIWVESDIRRKEIQEIYENVMPCIMARSGHINLVSIDYQIPNSETLFDDIWNSDSAYIKLKF